MTYSYTEHPLLPPFPAIPVEVEYQDRWQLPDVGLPDAVPLLLTLAALVL